MGLGVGGGIDCNVTGARAPGCLPNVKMFREVGEGKEQE